MKRTATGLPIGPLATVLVASGFLATDLRADTASPGFQITDVQTTPTTGIVFAPLSNGNSVVFDGQFVELLDPLGGFLMTLGTFPAPVFTAFVEIDPTETFALVAESSAGEIHKVDLSGGGMSLLATVDLCFDSVFEGPTSALVSRGIDLGGFQFDTDIVRLDTSSGSTALVCDLDGPSGPVAIDDLGDLYYLSLDNSFLPGSADVLRFTHAQIHAGPVLTDADAAIFVPGLDGGSSMAFDPVSDHLYLADHLVGIHELDVFGADVGLVTTTTDFLGSLAHVAGALGASMQAFQPADGTALRYVATDFATFSDIVTIEPRRPTATITRIGSVTTVLIEHAQPDAAFNLVWNPVQFVSPTETIHPLGLSFPFFTPLDTTRLFRFPLWIPLDGEGKGSISYFDPGSIAGTLVFQGVIGDATLRPIGTSEVVYN